MLRFFSLVALFVVSGFARAGDIQQLLQLVDYVGVDYAEAVADGQVINPAEYEEMIDFSAGIARHTAELPEGDTRQRLQQQGKTLSELIVAKAAPGKISELTGATRLAIIDGYNVTVVPRKKPGSVV